MPISQLISPLIGFAEAGRLPDSIVRTGMRRLLRARLAAMEQGGVEAVSDATNALLRDASASPIAVVPELANEQHYEVPAAFFKAALGPHLKYSCCHWVSGAGRSHASPASDGNVAQDAATLGKAEESALRLTCEHAGLTDGQRILELGCGWGSLSLWMAAEYPNSSITAISNSGSQREHIIAQAQERGLNNLDVQTCDINDFDAQGESFERVVSVEMFEHVRNHSRLMSQIHNWLTPGGQLFVHIFCHRTTPYLFENDGPASWMARTFFSGGMMPSQDWLLRCQHPLQLDQQWSWNGRHYERTCNAWLALMDQRHEEVASILQETYGDSWRLWRQRWRMFFMACAELFGLADGNEWFVTHMRFNRAN